MTTINLQTPLTGKAIGTVAEVNAFATNEGALHPEFTASMNAAIFELSPKANLRSDIVSARSALETGNWTALIWKLYKNPGGLAAFPDGTYAGGTFISPVIAAKAMLAHFVAYVYGKSINADTDDWLQYDPRWHEALALVREEGTISTVGEFGNGMWATSTTDAADLVTRFNSIFNQFSFPVEEPGEVEPPVAETIVFGRVPYADVIESHFPTSSQWVKSGAPEVPDALVYHRMIGTWQGTNSWGHSGNFATAYGVSVKTTDGVGGKIYEWLGPKSGLYGESSGPVSAPYGDGLALVNKVGVGNVNRVTKAIEISGNYDTPLDNDAKQAIAELSAYFADRKRIPWNQYPIVPGENRSFVVWHQELTIGTGKVCPGQVVMAATPELIEMTRAILKLHQVVQVQPPIPTTPPPAPEPVSIYPLGMGEPLARRLYGSVTVPWAAKPFTFDPTRSECLEWLDNGKKQLKPGERYDNAKWPSLEDVIRRGDGGRIYKFSDGTSIQHDAKEAA